MNSAVILEFETEESLNCFIRKRGLHVIEKNDRIAVISGNNTSDLAVKLSSEIGPLTVRLAFQFKDFRSIFKEYLTHSKIKTPADFRVVPLRNEDQIKLYYNIVEEAINELPGLEISEVEPRAVYNVFSGESSYLEIWGTDGIGGNACGKDEMIGVLFTGSKDSFNIALNAMKSGFKLKLFYPYTDETSLRRAIYLVWRLAKLGDVLLLAYRESGMPSLDGLAKLLSTSKTIKTILIPCETAAKIGVGTTLEAVMKTGIAPIVLGCFDEIKESKMDNVKQKFNESISLSASGGGKPVAIEIIADSSSMGMHNMLDGIIPHILAGSRK
ncbi:MAG: hypothetical protein JRN26_01430 [Nitrososphaerota archaeon]|jgi:hypothetical protein|nr:hypothetical protein [Nitrososphaerota archaeon]MDG6926933.1 hypothetical protein [Nitrososphaerota archaeon]MDG6930515.1 hypothetical protein [Nitrososphaerota archaeon]MDG6932190.1 hypothetical protein [Nitrososphaerota archaeon]MDG6935540.1 hypothetical protein [Nitrososphaerota archaeon]